MDRAGRSAGAGGLGRGDAEPGEQGGEPLHGESDDGGRVAGEGDGPSGVEAFVEVVCAGLALPEAGVEVGVDLGVGDAADGDLGGVDKYVAVALARVEDGDAGVDLVGVLGEGEDGLPGVVGVAGLADELAVLDDEGVGTEDEPVLVGAGGGEDVDAGCGLEEGEGGDPLLGGDLAGREGGVGGMSWRGGVVS